MGGGDLNLKKSWHPQTLRNVEKVWKAEQKHEAERKKIEELQRELREERAREEMQRYAEDVGAVNLLMADFTVTAKVVVQVQAPPADIFMQESQCQIPTS
ncbi:Pre-mRNA-splicing factor CWC25 like protein [Tupaia chinensis]|uniref:Pre-mRNA-splicing factor CWC25 like protein n=1 Tax=Tupaia chinensis TaxID=246437 RepID=L9JXC1_TUPCH|nr:Pre-mRNA-splicing factor CWC25 like protein [Tupaia chinensis]